MSTFKVGDKVVCIDASCTDGYLKLGNIYTIVELMQYDNVILEISGVRTLPWKSSRFKLAEPDFCMKTQPWFIRTNSKEEFDLAADFVKSKGLEFTCTDHWYSRIAGISNCSPVGCKIYDYPSLIRLEKTEKNESSRNQTKLQTFY